MDYKTQIAARIADVRYDTRSVPLWYQQRMGWARPLGNAVWEFIDYLADRFDDLEQSFYRVIEQSTVQTPDMNTPEQDRVLEILFMDSFARAKRTRK